MYTRKLSEVLEGLEYLERRGPDPDLAGIIFDSREAGSGLAFFALPGVHTDGHQYIPQVIAAGCPAVVHSAPLPEYDPAVAYLRVADTRFFMSPFSAAFFDHPSRRLKVIGVTGTDGKSSTVSFLSQLLELSGHPAGFFSTVEYKTGRDIQANSFRQSTPEAPQIQGVLKEMADHGLEYAVVESTSHGLSPRTNRLGDVGYDVAVFTNVTSEHLEFHGTLEQYRADKARLFSALDRSGKQGFGVVNRDDPHWQLFTGATSRPCRTYSLSSPDADLRASGVEESGAGLTFTLHWQGQTSRATCPLAGVFNVQNLLATLLAVSGLTGRSPLDLAKLLPGIRGVKGRMKLVDQGQDFRVIVDYAHTPGAFEKVLPDVRATTLGRLWVVFGSGGERDRVKRPQQGQLADQWADIVVLTDEDPRLEDPQLILEDIAAGVTGKTRGTDLHLVRPRREALRTALSGARAGDTVLLLGKGHEQSIIMPEGKTPWDEETVAREILEDLGWKGRGL